MLAGRRAGVERGEQRERAEHSERDDRADERGHRGRQVRGARHALRRPRRRRGRRPRGQDRRPRPPALFRCGFLFILLSTWYSHAQIILCVRPAVPYYTTLLQETHV